MSGIRHKLLTTGTGVLILRIRFDRHEPWHRGSRSARPVAGIVGVVNTIAANGGPAQRKQFWALIKTFCADLRKRSFLFVATKMKKDRLIRYLGRLTEHRLFQTATTVMILLTAVLMGLETNQSIVARQPLLFQILHAFIQAFFVAEIALRLGAHAFELRKFLRDTWNIFDVVVVGISLLPVAGPFALVARLARILRVARLVSRSEDLKLIIDTMFRSIPSLFHVSLLLGLLFYIYGITGYHLFGSIDPDHWGSLSASWMTLFKILTLEGWIEMLERVSPEASMAWIFFVSYIVIAVFVVINLFIAVVINNLQSVKSLKGDVS